MSSDWPQEQLSNLVTIKGGKRLPAGKSLQQEPNSHPYIRVRDVGLRDLPRTGLEYVPDELFPPISRYIVQPNDVVLSIVGTIGALSIVDAKYNQASLTENCVKLHGLGREDALYLFYYLSSPVGQQEIHRGTVGAVQPKLPIYNIEKIAVTWPDRLTRAATAEILGSIDDRITLLRETNATLEAIAQALFKSWFVDFDPVRVKMEGRAPEGMDEATAVLFPDGFEESALGLVPKGWHVRGIDETCELGRGSSPRPIQKFMGGDVPWIKIADATASDGMFVFETKEMVIQEGVRHSVEVRPGDLIMSNSASCGITVFVELNGCIHDGWLYFKNYQNISKNFLFFWLRKIADHLVHIADGSVQKNLNIALVSSQKIITPPSEVLQLFDNLAGPLLERIRENCVQAHTLESLRNTLLPRLISGQLRLPEAEALAA